MVYFLTLPEGAGHVANFLNRYGRSWSRHMAEATYLEFADRQSAPPGAIVFCDIERMNAGQRSLACHLWRKLSASPTTHRLLNDPHKQLGRFDLLRRLYETGLNEFNVFLATEDLGSVRYPAFVRLEHDHSGPKSGLLDSRAELEAEIDRLVLSGTPERQILIGEFIDTSEEGVFRKYGAYRIGDAVFGQHKILGTKWQLKSADRIRTPEARAENSEYYRENPHQELLMPVFEMAGIDYGRVDYGFNRGRLQVWEINDNPSFASSHPLRLSQEPKEVRYVECLSALSEGLNQGPPLEFSLFDEAVWSALLPESSREDARRP